MWSEGVCLEGVSLEGVWLYEWLGLEEVGQEHSYYLTLLYQKLSISKKNKSYPF